MNTTLDVFLEILRYTVPSLIILISVYLIISKFLKNEAQRRQLEVYKHSLDTTLRLRLQAYERISMFLERIHPRLLVTRVYQTGMTVRDFQTTLSQGIQVEFDHNLSQQIYISQKLWNAVHGVKEQTQSMINHIASQLNPESSAKELHKMIIEQMMTQDELPSETVLEILNQEAKLVLQQQA
jgi:hypothetical protein